MKNTVIIYHKGCNDGFGAAWSAWKKFGDSVEYIGEEHNQPIPKGLKGKDVYLVDFSYAKGPMEKILKIAKTLTVIDHHVSARPVVESLPNHVYDNDHSGAYLAWQYFHPGKPVPKLIQYIEDTDLWRFNLRNTKELMASLDLYEFDFKVWDKLYKEFQNPKTLKKHIEVGGIILKYEERIIEKAIYRSNVVKFEGYTAIATNSNVLTSEIGNRLTKIMPPIGIIYCQVHGKKIVSLRGNGKVDVSKLAQKHGGGGHKSAAGFQLKINENYPWKFIRAFKYEK